MPPSTKDLNDLLNQIHDNYRSPCLWYAHLLKDFLWWCGLDEAADVDVDEGGHQELAVEAIHDATVAGDDVTEVLEWPRKRLLDQIGLNYGKGGLWASCPQALLTECPAGL